MKISIIHCAYVALLCVIGVNAEAKLKIGIKKRVECTNKTKKGDLVHIHYTVELNEIS